MRTLGVGLAVAPDLFLPAVENLVASGVINRCVDPAQPFRRVLIEKPFGKSLETARHLNESLHQFLEEEQLYRIDHYLGKETVQNLLGFRFHNAIFEPLWNRHHVELVQITVAESIGVERGRAAYYDTSGALRDMLQNHMLQVLSLVAMEPPISLDPQAVRDQRFRSCGVYSYRRTRMRSRLSCERDTQPVRMATARHRRISKKKA